jgi:hypothetical protein
MARLNYWLGVLVDAVLAGWFLVHAMRTMHGSWVTTGVSLLAGLGLYGFLEYGVHRWGYHDDRSPATPGHRLHHVVVRHFTVASVSDLKGNVFTIGVPQ